MSVPDLVKIGSINTEESMNVETAILEPVINTPNMTRFVLERKGILHSYSKITVGINGIGIDDNRKLILPIYTGVYSLIDRVVLKAGAKVISTTENFNHIMTYRSRFVSNENNKYREQMLTGRFGAYRTNENIQGSGISANIKPLAQGVNLDCGTSCYRYELDGNAGLEAQESPKIGADGNNATSLTNTDVPGYAKYGTATENSPNSTLQVSLAEMFPFLKHQQIPLYLMREQLSIEIYWAKPSEIAVCAAIQPDGTPVVAEDQLTACVIDSVQTKLVADYLYFDQDIMDRYEQKVKTEGLTMSTVEAQLVKTSVQSDSALAVGSGTLQNGFTRSLGGAGRMIESVIIIHTPDQSEAVRRINILGKFKASHIETPSFNLNYNDRWLYPQNVTNRASLRDFLQRAEYLPLKVLPEEYSPDVSVQSIDSGGTWHMAQTTKDAGQLYGNSFYIVVALNRGDRINSRGLLLQLAGKLPRNGDAKQNYTQYCYLNVRKQVRLQNGIMTCYYE